MARNAVSGNENLNNSFSRWDVKKNIEEHRGLLSQVGKAAIAKKTARRQQAMRSSRGNTSVSVHRLVRNIKGVPLIG